MLIGAHVDDSDPFAEAHKIGATVAQIFLGDPKGWKGPTFAYEGGADKLRADSEESGLDLYVHAPYVINVASTNNRIRIPSRKLLQQTVDGAAEIGAKGVVVHGGHVSKDDDPAKGFDNWRKCIDGLDPKVPVLIENTAGGDHSMARRLDRIEQLWEAVQAASGAEHVGFCLDTCHAHAGGLALTDAAEQIRSITGRIDLVHANDSRDEFDSGADRHAHFGDGKIEPEDLLTVIRAADAPVVCETHGDMSGDITWLREQLDGSPS